MVHPGRHKALEARKDRRINTCAGIMVRKCQKVCPKIQSSIPTCYQYCSILPATWLPPPRRLSTFHFQHQPLCEALYPKVLAFIFNINKHPLDVHIQRTMGFYIEMVHNIAGCFTFVVISTLIPSFSKYNNPQNIQIQ